MKELLSFSKNEAGNDYIVGDIHGCYTLLMRRLKEVGFDKKADRLFSVGDLVDRGPESHDCLSLVYEPWFFAVRGNHESLMHDAVNGGDVGLWLVNGGGWCASYDPNDLRVLVNDVMGRLPLAIELEARGGTIGIIHADVTSGVWGDFSEQRDVWSRHRIERVTRDFKPVSGIDRVIVGHTILEEPRVKDNILHIDTGAFHTGKLTVINAEDVFSVTYTPEKDLNHNHVSPDHRYACLNRPKPGEPWLPLVESNSCGHTWRGTDPSCTYCKWRNDPC